MRFVALCLSFYALCPSAPALASELPTAHAARLSQARVSVQGNGDVVVGLQARGDLRGLVTLTIHRTGDTVTGEWSLVSAYFQDVDDKGNPIDLDEADEQSDGNPTAPYNERQAHVERVTYVNNGMLGGTIDAGHLVLDADGAVTGLETLHLTIVSSTLTFEGASGGGAIESSVLRDGGSLSLIF